MGLKKMLHSPKYKKNIFPLNNYKFKLLKPSTNIKLGKKVTKGIYNDYKIFIAAGVICKGETDHYEYISSAVANGLINLTINKEIYIANCILNVHNLSQANARSSNENNKGSEAAKAINLLFA